MEYDKSMRHERFVSNLEGGSIIEVIGLLLLTNCAWILRPLLETFTPSFFVFQSNRQLADCAILFLAIILPVTILADYIREIVIVFLTTCLLLCLTIFNRHVNQWPSRTHHLIAHCRRKFRALIIIVTCVCIYAVDFPIFPRRFAKTEAHGVSWMDTGVGLISLSCGLSNVDFIVLSKKSTIKNKRNSIAWTTIAVIILATFRTIVVKIIGYPEHVTEYGVHWNFFLTIAAIRLFGFGIGSLLRLCTEFRAMCYTCIIALFLTLGHQAMLIFGLQNLFAIDSDLLTMQSRNSSFLLANAEGFLTLTGYFSLYSWGLLLGLFAFVHLESEEAKFKFLSVQHVKTWKGDTKKVCFSILIVAGVFLILTLQFGTKAVSRRFVNMPYITLQIFLFYSTYGFQCLFESVIMKPSSSHLPAKQYSNDVFSLVADNSLVYFLIANLLTGGLNLLIDTLGMEDLTPVWFSKTCQLSLLSAYCITNLILLHVFCCLFKRK